MSSQMDILTAAQIEAQFKSEWVLVEDPQTNDALEVQSGRVRWQGRENFSPQHRPTQRSRGPSGRTAWSSLHPGHRPSASALGWALPARWAGQAGHSRPAQHRLSAHTAHRSLAQRLHRLDRNGDPERTLTHYPHFLGGGLDLNPAILNRDFDRPSRLDSCFLANRLRQDKPAGVVENRAHGSFHHN